jgi:hypothetical protein
MSPQFDEVPELLRLHDRWMLWERDGSGRKVPRAVKRPDRDCDGTRPSNWCDWNTLIASPRKLKGPGFALGAVDKGPTIAGIDLDGCRNPVTGVIEPWASDVIRFINSYRRLPFLRFNEAGREYARLIQRRELRLVHGVEVEATMRSVYEHHRVAARDPPALSRDLHDRNEKVHSFVSLRGLGRDLRTGPYRTRSVGPTKTCSSDEPGRRSEPFR